MAQKTINIGTGELTGDGESLRSALDKTNDNFTEVYADITDHETRINTIETAFKPPMLTQAQVDALTPELGMLIYNTTTGKFQGYAADANNDSTTAWADLH